MNPCNYNEAIQDKDATLWQRAMNIEMESIYSKSGLASSEFTLWCKIHRISEQEEEKGRCEDENLQGMASGEGKIS